MLQQCGQMAVLDNKHQSGTQIMGVRLPPHTTEPAEGPSVAPRPPSQHGSALTAGGPAPAPWDENLPGPSFKLNIFFRM